MWVCWLLLQFTWIFGHLDPWRWDRYVVPKRQRETSLPCITSQKMTEFKRNCDLKLWTDTCKLHHSEVHAMQCSLQIITDCGHLICSELEKPAPEQWLDDWYCVSRRYGNNSPSNTLSYSRIPKSSETVLCEFEVLYALSFHLLHNKHHDVESSRS